MAGEFIKLDNELKIKLKVKPMSPLLIKLGDEKEAEGSENTICFMTTKGGKAKYEQGKKVSDTREGYLYIPGSTLKGMFRERFHQIYYDYKGKDSDKVADNNFDDYRNSLLEDKELKSEDTYDKNLEIDKLFGSTTLKGRFFAQDSLIKKETDLMEFLKTRAITPIDRFTSGAVVPLNFEYTTEVFEGELVIKNVNLEELQTLYFVIRDSINGEIRVGNSKSRGFGQIELVIEELELKLYRNSLDEFKNLHKYFDIDEKNSMKLGDNYLYKSLKLKEENKMVDVENPNEFIKELFRGGN
jgi:CRISPR/Cas system CSM-associated protein Csm3 (group 7 of RAMP superfamily)